MTSSDLGQSGDLEPQSSVKPSQVDSGHSPSPPHLAESDSDFDDDDDDDDNNNAAADDDVFNNHHTVILFFFFFFIPTPTFFFAHINTCSLASPIR